MFGRERDSDNDGGDHGGGNDEKGGDMRLACQYGACRLTRQMADMRACSRCHNAWFCDARCEQLAASEHKRRCDISVETLGVDPSTFKTRLVLSRLTAALTHHETKIDWHEIYDIQRRFRNVVRVTYRTVSGQPDITLDRGLLVAALNRAWVRLHYVLMTPLATMERDPACPPEDARIRIEFVKLERLPSLPPPRSPQPGKPETPQAQILGVRSVAPASNPTAFVDDPYRGEATIVL